MSRIAPGNWHLVKQSTIFNFFSYFHFKDSETQQPETPTQDQEENIPRAVLMSHLRSLSFDINDTATGRITADDLIAISEYITDHIILNTIINPCTDHPVYAESVEEDGDPPPKHPSHAEVVELCAKLSIYLQSLPNAHNFLVYE